MAMVMVAAKDKFMLPSMADKVARHIRAVFPDLAVDVIEGDVETDNNGQLIIYTGTYSPKYKWIVRPAHYEPQDGDDCLARFTSQEEAIAFLNDMYPGRNNLEVDPDFAYIEEAH